MPSGGSSDYEPARTAPDLRDLAFDFFYWFSRFEYALKANGYLVISQNSHQATPNWDQFVSDRRAGYSPSLAAQALMEANPQEEVVTAHGLDFADLVFSRKLDVRKLVTHEFPLQRTAEAIQMAAKPSAGALKIMVTQLDR